MFATEKEARAYTDPAPVALIWQMLVAGLVGVGFYFRRITTWFRIEKVQKIEPIRLTRPRALQPHSAILPVASSATRAEFCASSTPWARPIWKPSWLPRPARN